MVTRMNRNFFWNNRTNLSRAAPGKPRPSSTSLGLTIFGTTPASLPLLEGPVAQKNRRMARRRQSPSLVSFGKG